MTRLLPITGARGARPLEKTPVTEVRVKSNCIDDVDDKRSNKESAQGSGDGEHCA